MFYRFYYQQHIRKSEQGFTLVEVMVSLALLATVVTMAVGTLLVLIDTNTKQQGVQSVVTNMSFALDSMTRDIRTGYFYECRSTSNSLTISGKATADCPSGESSFAFTESGDSLTKNMGSNRIAYRYNSNDKSIERRLGDPNNGGVDWTAITAPEVQVETFDFIVNNTGGFSDTGDQRAPTVTIFISGTAGNIPGLDTSFNLQTTVTQQVLDI